ncbi:MAG: RES family NAD+ phosphorylase [Gemmatimonadota bacterium]
MSSSGGEFFQVIAYRHSAPHQAEVSDAVLEASRRVGGRMNPQGEFGALYLALEIETAVRELLRKAELAGIPVEDLVPRVVMTVEIRLSRLLDLTDAEVRTEWGLSEDDLASPDHEACHQVARAARRSGYEAILFPSATGTGTNLTVFLDRLHPGSRVHAVGHQILEL